MSVIKMTPKELLQLRSLHNFWRWVFTFTLVLSIFAILYSFNINDWYLFFLPLMAALVSTHGISHAIMRMEEIDGYIRRNR